MHRKIAFGILIGMGIMLVLLGFFGWLHSNYCLEKLSYIFELVEIDPNRHYLIADLKEVMSIYVGFIVVGFLTTIISIVVFMKQKTRQEVKTRK